MNSLIAKATRKMGRPNKLSFFLSSGSQFHSLGSKRKIIQNKITSVQAKTIFNIFRGSNHTHGEYFKTQPKEEEYFHPMEPIVFKDDKYLVVESLAMKKGIKYFEMVLIPSFLFSLYKTVTSAIFFRPIKTILWAGATYVTGRYCVGVQNNKNTMITNIYLLKDGKTAVIQTIAKAFTVDITKIRRVTIEEGLYFAHLATWAHAEYVPLVIDNHFYIMNKGATIYDQDVLNAISNGKYVAMQKGTVIHRDDSIDI